MKKRFKFFLTILLVASLVFSFVSCSDLFAGSSTANVSFSLNLPKEFLASRNSTDDETCTLKINLFKSFNNDLISEIDTKEISIDLEKENKIKVVFDSVPIGETIIATAKISVGETLLFSGESNQITINRGVNPLTINLDPVENEVKINFGEITQSDVEIINESITSTDGFEKLIFRASDGFESYEWSYANITVEDQCLEIDTSKLPVGNYILSLIATKNGVEYSAQVEFRIEQKLSFNIEIVDLEIIKLENTERSIDLKATDGFDSYKWICENLTYEVQNITIQYSDLLNFEMYEYVLVRVVAVKDGVEYSEEKYIGELLYEEN